jgi:hypothetical protein
MANRVLPNSHSNTEAVAMRERPKEFADSTGSEFLIWKVKQAPDGSYVYDYFDIFTSHHLNLQIK